MIRRNPANTTKAFFGPDFNVKAAITSSTGDDPVNRSELSAAAAKADKEEVNPPVDGVYGMFPDFLKDDDDDLETMATLRLEPVDLSEPIPLPPELFWDFTETWVDEVPWRRPKPLDLSMIRSEPSIIVHDVDQVPLFDDAHEPKILRLKDLCADVNTSWSDLAVEAFKQELSQVEEVSDTNKHRRSSAPKATDVKKRKYSQRTKSSKVCIDCKGPNFNRKNLRCSACIPKKMCIMCGRLNYEFRVNATTCAACLNKKVQ